MTRDEANAIFNDRFQGDWNPEDRFASGILYDIVRRSRVRATKDEACLEGTFTLRELQAIIYWMEQRSQA